VCCTHPQPAQNPGSRQMARGGGDREQEEPQQGGGGEPGAGAAPAEQSKGKQGKVGWAGGCMGG